MLPLPIVRITSDKPISPKDVLAQLINEKKLPLNLYKYRDTGNNTKDIFINSKLWFSPPPLFNDPFDCQLAIDTTCSKAELQSFLKRNNPSYSRAEIRRDVEVFTRNPALLRNTVNEAARESLDSTGICCFGADERNLLMWSHYSNSHKGICLKFDVLAAPELFAFTFKVRYREEYPVLNHIREVDGASVNKILTTKSKDWAYENEYRVVKFKEPGLHSFPKEALTEVIFGCKATTPFINEIVGLARKSGFEHLAFKKAHLSQRRFALSIRPL